MNLKCSIACLAGMACLTASGAAADDRVAAEVRSVFAARCAACHGSDLAKPKGRFGYVLDLGRVAGNPEMVIPSRPEESELWILVQRGEMPPDDSPAGPLTAEEKEVIRRWIAAGAPDVSEQSPVDDSPAPVASPLRRTLRWLGKFHLLALHFPIALAVAAGLAELCSVWRRSPAPSAVVRFCLWLAAGAAVPTIAFGWLHAIDNGLSSPGLLLAHRWLGSAAGALLLAAALCYEWGNRAWWARLVLFAAVVLTVATAHFGGLLAQGVHFLDR